MPSVRIWPKGTNRLLGVLGARAAAADDADDPEVPDAAMKLLSAENDYMVWGDFHVCPVAPERTGWMWFVTVKRVRHLWPGSG